MSLYFLPGWLRWGHNPLFLGCFVVVGIMFLQLLMSLFLLLSKTVDITLLWLTVEFLCDGYVFFGLKPDFSWCLWDCGWVGVVTINFDNNAEVRQRYKYRGNMVLKYLCGFSRTERLYVQNPGLNAHTRIVQSQKATISKSAELDVEACQFFWMPNFEKEIWVMKMVAKVEKRWHSRMICMTNRVCDTDCGQICNGGGKGLS